MQLTIGDRVLTQEDSFVIAEIGANHMGDAELCNRMIIEAAKCGADAVKLQKRDNKAMFTQEAYDAPYDNELSYGKTYGEHREYLDWFGEKEYRWFMKTAEVNGVILFATPFEYRSADFLEALDMPLYKIASCDVTNTPLVRHVASFGKPMIISTGGAHMAEIEALCAEIEPINSNFAVLHCVSTYPNADDQLHLRVMNDIMDWTGKLGGFSSHHPGLMPHYLAKAMGGTIFESHFTLNRGQKGTDHGFSLEPHGLSQLCDGLKRIPVMMGNSGKEVLDVERDGFIKKMGKGYHLTFDIFRGKTLFTGRDYEIKSPGGGMSLTDSPEGRRMARDADAGEIITEDMLIPEGQ